MERNFFQKIPFIRITSLFLTGILISHYFKPEIHVLAIGMTILISTALLLWHDSSYFRGKVQNILIALIILLSGIFYPDNKPVKEHADFDRKDYFLAEVCQKPVEKKNSYQVILKIENNIMPSPEKVIVYFSKTGFDPGISVGDQLIVLAKPQEIKNMGNPFEFDYQALMHKKEIWYSVYLTEGTYLKTGHRFNRISYLAEKMRDRLIFKLSESINAKQELAVLEALTLGYRAELDRETINSFSSTGAMHVLAVSGLHVGLIYFILGFFLAPLKRAKIGRFLFPALMIAFLWSYAFITGFSPSVQRATVMFTFIVLGDVLRRPVNIFNSLTASALVLILLNPDVIFEVGFQLSYLAVFGIVLIQPKLSKLFEIKNKFLKAVWDLLTVSIAAQLATFPLGLFYFNQFPNFFWLSNFFVIPGATLIIWITFAFFVFIPIPFISTILAFLLQMITGIMLRILKLISQLPYALNEGIIIGPLEIFIIYGLLISLLVYGFSKRKQWLFYGLVLMILLQVSSLANNYKLLNQKYICIYNSKNSLIQLINGRTNYLITTGMDSIVEADQKMVKTVMNRLKLNEPILINRDAGLTSKSVDLIIDQNSVQFLNCKFRFNEEQISISRKAEMIDLSVKSRTSPGMDSIHTTISSGISYFNSKKDTANVLLTKQKGAFFIKL